MSKPIIIDPSITIGVSSSGTPDTPALLSFDNLQIVGLIKLQSNEEANVCYAGEIILIDTNVKQGEQSQLGLVSDALAMSVLAGKKEFEEITMPSKTTVINGLFERQTGFVVGDNEMEVHVYIEIELFENEEETNQQPE